MNMKLCEDRPRFEVPVLRGDMTAQSQSAAAYASASEKTSLRMKAGTLVAEASEVILAEESVKAQAQQSAY